ncbi:3-hydroxyadipyl-CoA dehydrogenase [mine drainage metagenome]|uniref:3-hydroxyadipyl-CoA dehydrogenase n=1 Tax=mine drainage metagenome TaxID=410659 RepID=A0A1J5RUJ1_9ZZZZ
MSSEVRVAVIGAGAMGRGIAQVFAAADFGVTLCDSQPGVAAQAKDGVAKQLDRSVQKGSLQASAAAATLRRITVGDALTAISGVTLVVEAIIEDLEAKQKLFAQIEGLVSDDCIIASNTSSLSITSLAARCRRPERVAGFHFFNPVPVMRLIEVIDGLRTDCAVVDELERIGKKIGKEVVRVKDTPGFLVNQIGRGFTLEAMHLVAEGVSTCADVDRVMRDAAGFRMGPFELLDMVGLDVNHPATEAIYSQFYHEPRYRPSVLMDSRVRAGLLGRKTNAGFYVYKDGKPLHEPEPVAPTASSVPPVWVSQDEPAEAAAVIAMLARVGVPVQATDKPSAEALCLITPLGEDASRSAARQGLDPVRTVAIDTLFGLDKRRTLMTTCVTSAEWRNAAHAILASDAVPVTVIRDSPGFIAQRILAMIVNIGTALAQSRTALPADIDKAVKLALSYPQGPLAFGDSLGVTRIGKILRNLYSSYSDPRYRQNLWIARRAALGIGLHEGD